MNQQDINISKEEREKLNRIMAGNMINTIPSENCRYCNYFFNLVCHSKRCVYSFSIEEGAKPMNQKVTKVKNLDGNVNNTDVVIVYGDVKGNINNCDNVIIINGDVKGNVSNCDNISGLLAEKLKVTNDG